MRYKLTYLVLTECEGHAFTITSNLNINISESLKDGGDRVLKLIIALGLRKAPVVSIRRTG